VVYCFLPFSHPVRSTDFVSCDQDEEEVGHAHMTVLCLAVTTGIDIDLH